MAGGAEKGRVHGVGLVGCYGYCAVVCYRMRVQNIPPGGNVSLAMHRGRSNESRNSRRHARANAKCNPVTLKPARAGSSADLIPAPLLHMSGLFLQA